MSAIDHPVQVCLSVNERLQQLQRYGSGLNKAWKASFHHPLCDLIKSLPVLYFASGSIDLYLELSVKNESNSTTESLGYMSHCNIQRLLAISVDSPFGKGTETVIDHSVRKGREISANKLSLSNETHYYCRGYEGIARLVGSHLFPGRQVAAKFYKLAIYEPGGHFEDHRDTTHSNKHHATLLIEVVSEHTGGDLVLTGHNGEEWYRWSLSGRERRGREVRYIAFYTDVLHRVEPVTSGYRVVLQFDIEVEGTEGVERFWEERMKKVHADGKPKAEAVEDDEADEDEEGEEDDESGLEESGRSHCEDMVDSPDTYFSPPAFDRECPPSWLVIDPAVLAKIAGKLHSMTSARTARVALPLHFLYRQCSLKHEYLKSVDRALYEGLADQFTVQLVPIVITMFSDFVEGELTVHAAPIASNEKGDRIVPWESDGEQPTTFVFVDTAAIKDLYWDHRQRGAARGSTVFCWSYGHLRQVEAIWTIGSLLINSERNTPFFNKHISHTCCIFLSSVRAHARVPEDRGSRCTQASPTSSPCSCCLSS